MFRFEEQFYLYLIIIAPIILALFYFLVAWKKNRLEKFGDSDVVQRLMPEWSVKKEWIKTGLFSFSILLMFVALANPQWGTRKQKVKAKSSDIVIALDISQSMLATDISPNRMEKAKRFTSQLIKNLKGERLGLIFFAGSAYLQMPLTSDYAATELFIKSANPKQAGTQGTVIADAINLSRNIFSNESPYQKALVLITDGENHESAAIDAAREAAKDGTYVFCIGVGSQEGSAVPILQNGREVYKKDKDGNPVLSRLNIPLLQDIAEAANGKFYLLDDGFSLTKKIVNDLSKIEKQEVEQRSFTDYNSYFQYFLAFAFIALLLEYFISNKKGNNFNFKNLFKL